MDDINQSANFQQPLIPQPIQKDKNIFKYLFFVLLILFLGIIITGYFVLTKKINTLSQQIPTQTQTNVINEITITPTITNLDTKTFLNSIQTELKTSSPIRSSGTNFWINSSQEYVPLKGDSFSLAGTVSNEYVSRYGNYSDITDITADSFKSLITSFDSIFINSGFQKDAINTINKIDKDGFGSIYLGYTNGNTKCLITLQVQSDPFCYVFCGIVDEQQLVWVREVYSAINPNKDPDTVVSVSKLEGNYATGGAGFRQNGGGYAWIAVKINNVWKKVWGGNDVMDCGVVNQYQIPKDIYTACE